MLRLFLILCLLLFASLAKAKLEVNLEPSNKAVKENIIIFLSDVDTADLSKLKQLYKHVDQQATQAAQALGYYHTRNHIRISDSDKKPVLHVDVELGSPVILNQVNIEILGEGKDSEAFQLPVAEELAPGKKLNHSAYEGMKSLINNRALNSGYFSGKFVQRQLLINVETNRADIILQYQTGPRYQFGNVTFSRTIFNQGVLERMVPFDKGAEYQADQVAEFNRDLLASGYFSHVKVTPQPDQAENLQVPIEVSLTLRDPHSLGVGGGYSTDVGARAKLAWDQHWLNPEGHSRGAVMELSRLRQNLSTYYQVPLDNQIADNLRYFAGLQHEYIDDVETESVVLGAELHKALGNDWERTIGLRAQHDDFSLGEASGDSQLLIPSVTFQRLTVSNRINPDYGFRLLMDVEGAARGLISTVDFARVLTQAKGLYTFLDDHRVLARLRLGAVATNEFDDIPPSLRFFAGGDQSVRGYGYQELSPEDRNGENIGGRYLMTSSVEYQYEFIDKWRLATFVDYGNAVNNVKDPLKTSVGVGLRWSSPIGSIRIDVAKSLSDPDEDFRIHFSMGPEL